MRKFKISVCITLLVFAMLACNAATGIRAAQTEIPALLTSAPTMLGPLGTAAAQMTPSDLLTALPITSNTPIPGTLGISLVDVKMVMEITRQFSFKDGTVDGKPASIAMLTSTAAASFPVLADGFSAEFIGDASNLVEIRVTVPRSEDKTTVDQGIGLLSLFFSGILPPQVQMAFIPWITENYLSLAVDGSKELASGNLKFRLSRDQVNMMLDITPLK